MGGQVALEVVQDVVEFHRQFRHSATHSTSIEACSGL